MKKLYHRDYFPIALAYAKISSGCVKVQVGSVIARDGNIISLGANRAIPDLCKFKGCLRVEKYGDDSKLHRNPEDCRAIHSEIDALCNLETSAAGCSIHVTRYPCEGCAKAIVAAGIKEVYYAGDAEISDQTRSIFEAYNVSYTHITGLIEDKTDR